LHDTLEQVSQPVQPANSGKKYASMDLKHSKLKKQRHSTGTVKDGSREREESVQQPAYDSKALGVTLGNEVWRWRDSSQSRKAEINSQV
jgi:hypothetical protein